MTAWQDEPPLTRRQIRMRERGGRTADDAARDTTAPAEHGDWRAPSAHTDEAPAAPRVLPVPVVPGPSATTGPIEPGHQLTRRELRALRAASGAAVDEAAQPLLKHEVREEVRQEAQPAPLPVENVSADFAQIMASPSIDTAAIQIVPSFPASDKPPAHKPFAAGETYTPPFGHWSMQAKIDDENQTLDHSVRRDLSTSSGAITTSALVLPSIPKAGDVTRPISNTGEILITGSIELPLSLGTTGSYPTHFDRSDVDAIIAADDREDTTAGSAPVRAIRAVSTNNDTPALIADPKGKDNRTPFVLAIIAAATLVGVVALVIAGFIFNVF
jgi:hypothetical protein